MFKLLLFAGIMLAVLIIALAYIFRHELGTLGHKYNEYDEVKKLQHEIKRKNITYDAHVKKFGSTVEAEMLEKEIKELEQLKREMEQSK
ncbi:hypothetical protein GCM10007275_07610 [Jeotgalicoccus coquinae]|uniref:Uncharacterized protein n=1 Tax=Jeotgalicoccus coquinae TaxID=709509 RepID=A0A6V7RJU6_9STAP|nr:hypothetical protein [Jeotgalicoccus coquinae]MBB6422571.1 hypothetical protein [Jeotgalicoccus coquinae]GGE14830.1 hypothetical protein GCM10007275_07610 [Jeotgalicoccus coquinae]CAD2078025.1 hypothetical protein JEOCOQ751_01089 [Jeotgalicoccus coquinae]